MTHSTLPEATQAQSGLVRSENGFSYRDLNKNGRLDVYEDPRQPVEARVDDLLSQMSLEEKAGLMFIHGADVNDDGSIEARPGQPLVAVKHISEKKMNHFNLWGIPGVQALAKWQNNLQGFAERTRLGIPITLASDPRNHFTRNIFSMAAQEFSQWCETPGFAAINDPELVRRFADIVRREYLAVGIRVALHPQIDLATEPRWPRISGSFSEDAHLTARMVRAYLDGFQGESLGPESVACMTKHFPGGGPQKDGLDPHFPFQQGQIYPGKNFDYHLIPFEAAFEANTAAIMPYYGVPMDQTSENVAMSFNKTIITDLLRKRYGYDGVVCTDWGLVTDMHVGGELWPARAWGVEHLSREDRVWKIIEAGADQFGGEVCADLLVGLVRSGKIPEARIDQSVRRLLRLKFVLGLFDNPFVEEAHLKDVFGNPESISAGQSSQERAMTLLKNEGEILPLVGHPSVYVRNIDPAVAANYATLVDTPEQADFAILRLETPWVPIDINNRFAYGFHHGDLDFKGEAKEEILAICAKVPTIVVIYLDRPAVIPEISVAARALLGEFGASDEAVLNVIFDRARPEGRLPFELPSSMEAVRAQKPDLPYDSKDPLYPFGFGLSYL